MFKLEEGQHRFTEIQVLDEVGAGNSYHLYSINGVDSGNRFSSIKFQKEPVAVAGVNGTFIEDLLQICRHRLQCFQSGDFACRENALALTKIEEALHWLDHRTKDRQKRNVEGTNAK